MEALVVTAIFVLPFVGLAVGVAFGPAIRAFIAVCVTDLQAAHKQEVADLTSAKEVAVEARQKAEADLNKIKTDTDLVWSKAKAEYEKVIAELKARVAYFEGLIRGNASAPAEATSAAAVTTAPPINAAD